MIKIAILDDEEEALEKEEQITRQYFHSKKVECEITLYQSSEWFLLGLKEEKFDLYILDAEMPGKNGMESRLQEKSGSCIRSLLLYILPII